MANTSYRPPRPKPGKNRPEVLDQIANQAINQAEVRLQGYREQSLRLFPWVCARCGREFSKENLTELTVHHKDHNHDNNPPDGSNWENLCIYCHDQEHEKYVRHAALGPSKLQQEEVNHSTYNPFANLQALLAGKNTTSK
ncbi:MAG: HNH nuclease family protein [Magnetococcales bacterium]|nr:HNH nuclease family protein [Magnetococcales bacterium]NGZ27913.1 HNH nuclease family protein [Magnetococcales bacterium]